MKTGELIDIASIALEKRMSYEDLMYSDYMYGKEEFTDDVWELVTVGIEKGMEFFRKEYLSQ